MTRAQVSQLVKYLKNKSHGQNLRSTPGQAEPISTAQVCRSYLHGRGLVWFNISQDNAGGWLNEEITLGKRTGIGYGLVWFNISQDNAGGWLNEEITLGKHTGAVWFGLVQHQSGQCWRLAQ